jgi:hypothetical protein
LPLANLVLDLILGGVLLHWIHHAVEVEEWASSNQVSIERYSPLDPVLIVLGSLPAGIVAVLAVRGEPSDTDLRSNVELFCLHASLGWCLWFLIGKASERSTAIRGAAFGNLALRICAFSVLFVGARISNIALPVLAWSFLGVWLVVLGVGIRQGVRRFARR